MYHTFLLFCFFIVTSVHCDELQNHIEYCDPIEIVENIPSSSYKEVVAFMPIPCVDVFLYDPNQNAYLLLYRTNAPAKDMWWYPGGRIYKGESFFDAAKRKCWAEAKIAVTPVAQLGTYSTVFPDSAWNCPSHTINTVVLVINASESIPALDELHGKYVWQLLDQEPLGDNPCTLRVYHEAVAYLKQLSIRW